MTKPCFYALVDALTSRGLLPHGQRPGFHRVLSALCALAPELITHPNFMETHTRIANNPDFYPFFKDCVGAMNDKLVPAWVPRVHQNRYRSWKGGLAQNVLAICDFDMNFTYVYAGWEGSAVDARVVDHAVSQDHTFPFSPIGILQCGHIEIDTHLITALVERWRPETHTFHFSVGEATVTLQDISIIWALPIEALLYWLLNNTCDDESPFDAVLQEARVCVMCIIGGILCPDATGNTVSLLYLRHMEIIDEERPSNWGIAVLAYLYRELCMASQRGKSNIGGAMQLLQIWAWSRIITLAPIPSNNAADLMPTVIDVENILPISPYAARYVYLYL
ncbi:Serine/threonine-protein phosphatase 7 long form [Sesamum angolense]|uniref:Serine/threonine-protein phosphatase 7 long form n=1 Tax=Sesamum angolense TaxID=2727404 RepID=A0AAE1WBU3_9LAMI|nr:Serine/threonine-protein phosphatase 7 long form [Sesamum angolense]